MSTERSWFLGQGEKWHFWKGGLGTQIFNRKWKVLCGAFVLLAIDLPQTKSKLILNCAYKYVPKLFADSYEIWSRVAVKSKSEAKKKMPNFWPFSRGTLVSPHLPPNNFQYVPITKVHFICLSFAFFGKKYQIWNIFNN